MLHLVLIRSPQIRHQRPTMSRDDDTTFPRRRIHSHILCPQSLLLGSVTELRCKIVLSNAADVDGRVRGEDVLGSADGILAGSAGDVVDFVFGDEFVVEGDVFVFCEDGVVGLEIVSVRSAHKCHQ